MRVLIINTVLNSGSTGKIVATIKNLVEKHGDECFAAYGRGEESGAHYYRIQNTASLFLNALLARLFDSEGMNCKRATKRLIKYIEKIKPDVINLHNIHGYYLNFAILFNYLKKTNIKVFWTLHDCWPFTGHCSYYTLKNCLKWQTRCSNCPNKSEYPKSIIDKSSRNYEKKKQYFTSIDDVTLITPSKWLKDEVEKSYLSKYKTVVINNGINYFDLPHERIKTSKKVLLGVANVWDGRKGLNVFNELADLINNEYEIVLVGVKDNQKKNVSNKIKLIDRTKNFQELCSYYASAHYYVNPTFEDNFPTTNLESIMCGTPLIVFNSGGAAEVVNETNGYVCSNKTAKSILDIINNKPYHFDRKVIRDNAMQYLADTQYEHYYELFKQ